MSTPSTERPEYPCMPEEGMPRDDRHPGVHLLEHDDDCKTTAELIDRRYWRICDWELMTLPEQGEFWMPRWWHSVPIDHLQVLARLTEQALAQPPTEQGALPFEGDRRPLPKSEHGEWWCCGVDKNRLHVFPDGAEVFWKGQQPVCPTCAGDLAPGAF